MPDLLSLPNELLQQVASFLPCSSVLNLLRVNHQLRDACNDRLVFQNILINCYADSCLSSGREAYKALSPWPEIESIQAASSLDEIMRLAFAAEQCAQASSADDNAWTIKISKRSDRSDVMDWLPQMLVLRHVAALNMEPHKFLELQGRLHPRNNTVHEKDFLTVNFVVSYLLLRRLRDTFDPDKLKEPIDHFFSVNRSTDPPVLIADGRRIDGDGIKSLRQRVPSYGEVKNSFDLNQATALLPTLILELAGQLHSIPILSSEPYDCLPAPHLMPFASMMDMPPVLEQGANPAFGECHIKKMATPEFMAGEWMGYYSDQRGDLSRRHFDPPMRNIQIITRVPDTDIISGHRITVVIDRQTRGVDAHGEFSLQGYISEGGFVHIVKQYMGLRLSWTWLGRLTPFGIVGFWGGPYAAFGGYFWIWKHEWTDGSPGKNFDEWV